jgi:arylformamidase
VKHILLSYYIDNNSPYYIGTTKPSITPNNEINGGDDYNTYILRVENHCGTHVDAPKHFIDSGKGISDFNIMELTFEHPLILEFKKGPGELITLDDFSKIDLNEFDCILFKTGFGKYRDKDLNKYLTQNPGISPETVQWLRKTYKNIKCLGIDCISISRYNDDELAEKTHMTAFKEDKNYGDPLLLVEDMKLHELSSESGTIKSVIVVPWQIKGIDSAPCMVIANLNRK